MGRLNTVLCVCVCVCVCVWQSGDTVLIGAVRGGHVEIVRALLHKYADIDIRGQVRADDVRQISFPRVCQQLWFQRSQLLVTGQMCHSAVSAGE